MKTRSVATAACLLLAAAGCVQVGQVGLRYRVEREFWRAGRAMQNLEVRRGGASAEEVDKIRQGFLKVLDIGQGATDPAVREVMGASLLRDYDLLLSLRRGSEASVVLERILREYAGDSLVAGEALWRRGLQRMGATDTAGAMEDFRMVVRQVRPLLQSSGVRAQVMGFPFQMVQFRLRREGRLRAAEEAQLALHYYYGVVASLPRSPEALAAHAYVGDLYTLLGNPAQAIPVLDSLQLECRQIPDQAVQRQNLLLRLAALSADQVGDPGRAHAYLDLLARDYPKSALRGSAQLMRGRLFVRQKRNEEGQRTFRAVAEDASLTDQPRAMAWLELGRLADLQNQWDEAQRCYREAATNFPLTREGLDAPMYTVAHFHALKDAAGERAALAEARRSYEGTLGRYPDVPASMEVRRRLVSVCAQQGDWKSTVDALSQIAERQPDTQMGLWALFQMARVHEVKLQNRRAALEDFRKILARFPQGDVRARAQAEIRRLGG